MLFDTRATAIARADRRKPLRRSGAALFLLLSTSLVTAPVATLAQNYRFSAVKIEGNQRIEQGAILGYAGIARGQAVSAGELNAAYQNIVESGLFESVEIEPRGNTLVIKVKEFPTINRISIEGNRRLKDDALKAAIQSKERFVYSPNQAERDAAEIAAAYNAAGRVAARVSPKIIRRSDNRVDLVFEVFEGAWRKSSASGSWATACIRTGVCAVCWRPNRRAFCARLSSVTLSLRTGSSSTSRFCATST